MFKKIDKYTMEETKVTEKKIRYSLPELIGRKDALRLAIRRIEKEKSGIEEKIVVARALGLRETFEEI